MTIPIAAPEVSDDAKNAVCKVLDSGMLAEGDEVRKFESEFAEYVGTNRAVATSSGTTALQAMFEAAGLDDGDSVVTSPFSFAASANTVVHAGAKPVFADIDPETFNLDPEKVRAVVEARDDVAALMPVHLYGLPAQMDEFRAIADEHDLLLFEDAAQAHGATFDGVPVGCLGDAASFSFYPTKNMTTGEGGIVTTNDESLADRLQQVVNHGRTDTYVHEFPGYNFRMTNINAAIGREQLNRLSDWVVRRRENARQLTKRLSQLKGVDTPVVPDDRTHAFHQYTVQLDDRDAVVESLKDNEIGFGIYYPMTIPDQPAYDHLEVDVPIARRLADRVLSLPVHPGVDGDDIETIGAAVTQAVEQ